MDTQAERPNSQEKEQQKTTNHSAAEHSEKHPGVEPSGPRGDNPATAGPGKTQVNSKTPENSSGHLNPSAPEDANTTPGTTGAK
jgi:hypothetical protein